MNLALIASIAALGVGPWIHEKTRGPWAVAAVDAFALAAVAGLVSAHIVPQSFALAGWLALPALLLGLFGPGLLCGSRLLSGKGASRITLPLALLGIALHALLDGVALSSDADPEGAHVLALAIVLHRIPDGLGIWWLARPRYGRRVAAVLLATLAVFSIVGFSFAETIAQGATSSWFGFFQALIAGSLLHVILRHPPGLRTGNAANAQGAALASGFGGLLGIALVIALDLFGTRGERHESFDLFLQLAYESAPALLAGYLLVALLRALGTDLRAALGRGGTFSQALRGTAIGLPMPTCSCGVVPLYRSLVEQRVPAAAALSFLVAAPELGVTALLLSWGLLGAQMTLARAACAAALALVVGLAVGPSAETRAIPPAPSGASRGRESWSERLRAGLRYGLVDTVDATAPWILAGLALAAVLEPVLDPERLAFLSPAIEVPIFALIGMPLYVCASGSTPLAAVLIANGVSPGAAIAFLLTGPATNVTTFGLLANLHSKRTALVFALVVAATTIALGWTVDAFFPGVARTLPERLHEHVPTALEIASAFALLAIFVHSLLRQGTRRFLSPVLSPYGESADDHPHDHGDHDHGDHAACASPTPAR